MMKFLEAKQKFDSKSSIDKIFLLIVFSLQIYCTYILSLELGLQLSILTMMWVLGIQNHWRMTSFPKICKL